LQSPPWGARLAVGGGRPVILVVASFVGSEQLTLPLVTVPANTGWSKGLPVVKMTFLQGSQCIACLWCYSVWSGHVITCEAVDLSAKGAGAHAGRLLGWLAAHSCSRAGCRVPSGRLGGRGPFSFSKYISN
jgi:hypothetical protein